VSFDIDQNGILNVSAKDLGTGKEAKVTIEQSSGLDEATITQMQRDAEAHAAEDKRKRELAELRNQADAMAFQLEKSMKEHADKLKEGDKEPLEKAIAKVRETAKGEDPAAIKSAIEELEQASHAFSKTLYESAQQAGGDAAAGAAAGEQAGGAGSSDSGDDDVVDAEFEVKKD